jgi:hypothetical protein
MAPSEIFYGQKRWAGRLALRKFLEQKNGAIEF